MMKPWIPGAVLIFLGFVALVMSFAMSEGMDGANEEAILNASMTAGRISVILFLGGVVACLLAVSKDGREGETDGQ